MPRDLQRAGAYALRYSAQINSYLFLALPTATRTRRRVSARVSARLRRRRSALAAFARPPRRALWVLAAVAPLAHHAPVAT